MSNRSPQRIQVSPGARDADMMLCSGENRVHPAHRRREPTSRLGLSGWRGHDGAETGEGEGRTPKLRQRPPQDHWLPIPAAGRIRRV